MKKQPKRFYLYLDSIKVLDFMTDEQAGLLFRAIKDYQDGKEPTLDKTLSLVFVPFKNQFDREHENYEKTCKKNKANATKSNRNQSPPFADDKDTDKDKDTKKDNLYRARRNKKSIAELNREVLKELADAL